MSPETAKGNASAADSSLTEWKQDMGNSEDPETASFKAKEESSSDPCREEEEAHHCHDRMASSATKTRGKLCNTRYFIIKSLSHQNIQLSIEKGIWATQVMNEPVLEEAFLNSSKVILIFSVNMSGFFQGYAQMMSAVGWRRDDVWSKGTGKSNPWGRSFRVKWLRLNDLPFQKTLHLKNPLNDYKPVKISRDCQELSPDIGEALCDLLDGTCDFEGPVSSSFSGDNFPSKRPCVDPPCSFGNEEYNIPASQFSWSHSQMHMLYPSVLYPHHGGADRCHFAQHRTGFNCSENSPFTLGASKVPRMNHNQTSGLSSSLRVDTSTTSRLDAWGLSTESPIASSLTEDDFLEMSYEEYLEVHSRSSKHFCLPASGSSGTTQDSSGSKKRNDDMRCSRKRNHHSSD